MSESNLSSAAALLGAKGGRAGKGKAKVRRTSFSSSYQPNRCHETGKPCSPRYLDCEDCRESGATCETICTDCGRTMVPK